MIKIVKHSSANLLKVGDIDTGQVIRITDNDNNALDNKFYLKVQGEQSYHCKVVSLTAGLIIDVNSQLKCELYDAEMQVRQRV